MSAASLSPVTRTPELALYEYTAEAARFPHGPRIFIVSTPETRRICNDPFLTGVRYTSSLSDACARTIRELESRRFVSLAEDTTSVLNILRGGLNFGLREALARALSWNDHCSLFLSAQRARKSDNPHDWVITESDYQKVDLHHRNDILLGDVVATGTSLAWALERLGDVATNHHTEISSLLFFTIGSPRSHEILAATSNEYARRFKGFRGSVVVYFEGIFPAATPETAMQIKLDGTDLLRTGGILAPEFIESQYEAPAYPIERCTIYDAGSRAFHLKEYLEDVHDYWSQTLALAEQGLTFKALLRERFPELEAGRFGSVDLVALARTQRDRAIRH